jgi:hypothetical protein
MSDFIDFLPTDDAPLTPSEQLVMNTILPSPTDGLQNLLQDLKMPVLFGLAFLIINLPQVSDLIKNTVPYANSSDLSLLLFKTALFVLVVFLCNNLQHLRK